MIRKVTIMKSSHTKTAPVPAGSAEVAGVEFKDQAPEAQDVFLVGSFNDWNVGIQRAPRGACAGEGEGRLRPAVTNIVFFRRWLFERRFPSALTFRFRSVGAIAS
jgi:hypothetical protein